ncbi:MAG: PAS domain S-box protein [Calothrix sp. MO_192.B10]|nr:PAS domain S-box protein [Calothrix sp. MO_192.B10]
MADDSITLDKQTYASLQEEIIALRQKVAGFQSNQASLQENRLLNGVIQASNCLLTIGDFEQSINQALAALGVATNTQYVSIWEYSDIEEPVFNQCWWWVDSGVPSPSNFRNIPYQDVFSVGEEILSQGNCVAELVQKLPLSVRSHWQSQGIVSLLSIPILIQGKLWGIITFGDGEDERQWLDSEISILKKAGLNFAGAIAQNQIKIKLQESQQLLQLVMDNIPQLIFWKDRNYIYQGCNRNGAKVTGFDVPEAIVGKSEDDMPWTLEEALWYRECDRRVMESGQPELHIIETQQQADGRQAWLDTNKIPLRDSGGNVVGVLITIEDITERKQAETNLQLIQFALDNVNDNVFLIEPNGSLFYVNAASCRNLGYSHGELAHMSIFDIDAVLSIESWSFHWEELKELKQTLTLESVYRTKDGREFPVEVSINYLEFNGKEYNYAVAHDITKRRQAEVQLRQLNEELETRVEERTKQLHQQEIQYRSIFEAVSDGLFITDLETGILVEANPAACISHGYTYEEFIGKYPSAYIHPDYHPILEKFISAIKAGKDFHCQSVDVRKDGSLLDVEVMGTPFIYNGKPHALTIVRDITERKRAELILQNRAKRLRSQNSVLSDLAKNRIIYQGDLQLVGREITAATAHSLRVERVSVWLYNEDKTCLQCLDLYEVDTQQHSQGIQLPVADYPAYFQGVETEDIIAANDAHTDPRTQEFSTGYLTPLNITAMLDCPIRLSGQTMGVLCIEKVGVPWRWYPEDEGFARSIADIFTLAIEARDRQKIEDILRQKEVQYRSIFEAVSDGILINDLDTGNVVEANPAACQMFGYSYEELLNIHPLQVIHPDSHQVFADFIHTIRAGHQFHGEAIDVRKDGTLFDVEASGTLCMYQGKQHGLVVIRDISDRKQAEIKLKQQAEDLENTLRELQRTQGQLIQSEKLSSLGQMVAGVAHEINNPVNFIHGNLVPATEYTQDLLRLLELYQQYYPNPPSEIEEEIETIDLEFLKIDIVKLLNSMGMGTQRIREIVLSLRNFSRLDEAEFKQVDIHEGIDSTLMILQNRLKATPERPGITIVKEYASLPPIECYPGQLNQVFMNILANAIDALEEYNQQRTYDEIAANPSSIRILTEKNTKNKVTISISDNGTGIPPEVQKKLFDPFFTTKDVGKGTGLGLSISYQIIVEKHGGKLSCQSTLGKGTEFAIQIPIIQG